LNKRKPRLDGEVGVFVKHYGRTRPEGEPNDRRYDRKMKQAIKRRNPQAPGALINGEDY
jgi:hypothetical protein